MGSVSGIVGHETALFNNLIHEIVVVAQTPAPTKENEIVKKNEYHFAKDIILKDVVLLPSPEYKKVPRGKSRENLFTEGYVASAIEIHSNWSQEDATHVLGSLFQEKLKDLAEPRYGIYIK